MGRDSLTNSNTKAKLQTEERVPAKKHWDLYRKRVEGLEQR